MKSKALIFFVIFGFFMSCGEKDDSLIFRNIGHTLLLHLGDSTSRVMPVQTLGDQNYLITFESEFQLIPDTLINIIQQHLAHNAAKKEYRVQVFNCDNKVEVYGYEVSRNNDFSIPCTGRVYPKACYKVQIQLLKSPFPTNLALGFSALGLILIGFMFFRKKPTKEEENQDFVVIGTFKFYPKNKLLIHEKEKISLSEKEARLLSYFAKQPNEIIDREDLLKEVWENDGVFVIGRNLDVLVSKLRKKLQNDPKVMITNSHGKGYGLEC